MGGQNGGGRDKTPPAGSVNRDKRPYCIYWLSSLMEKAHPKEWTLRCDHCTLNGASCFYRHYPKPTLEEALKVNYPKGNGKIKPYRPAYENGTGKPSCDKPANMPAPRDRSKSPTAAGAQKPPGKTPDPSTIQTRLAQQMTMEPKFCAPMMNTGPCPNGDKCPLARHHAKTKDMYATQMERWRARIEAIKAGK